MNKKIKSACLLFIFAIAASLFLAKVVLDNIKEARDKKAVSVSAARPVKDVAVGRIAENPLDCCVQEDKPLSAGELISFALEWINPNTGLAPTIIAKTETKNALPYYSSTYADAVIHQTLIASGRLEEAVKMAECFRQRGQKYDLPNAFDSSTALCSDSAVSAGPNAYWGIGFIREYQATNDIKWLEAAKKRADMLIWLQDNDGGIKKSPFAGDPESAVKSTEENLDCYAFFNILFSITRDDRYETARKGVLGWLAKSGVYDKKKGYFVIGTLRNKVTSAYGLDANSLAIIILGPDILNATEGDYIFSGADTARKIVESFDNAKVKVDYAHPSGVTVEDIVGFDFTDDAGRSVRKKAISPEFTAQVLLAYLVMAYDAKEKGDLVSADKFLRKTQAYLCDLGRMAARSGKSASLPYCTEKDIRRFSFDNWLTPSAEANMSGLWTVFPLVGFNPFAQNGFEIRDSLKGMTAWVDSMGEIAVSVKAVVPAPKEKIVSEVELIAPQQAEKKEALKPPVVYYEVLYEQVKKDRELARRRAILTLMTSYHCWIDARGDSADRDYEVIGISDDNKLIKKKLSELPDYLRNVLNEEYLYYDETDGIKWYLASKYNLDIDYSRGSYYAFELDENYNIVRQFKTESDVPKENREDLRDIKAQYQSNLGLEERHLITRYFAAIEVSANLDIVATFDRLEDLPGIVSKIPISRQKYEAYLKASEEERQQLISAGVVPNDKGELAEEISGLYYTRLLNLDETRRMRVASFSVKTNDEIIMGSRFALGNWRVNEIAKLNALKYERGLIDGMVIKPRKPFMDEKPSLLEPLWIYIGKDTVKRETKEFKKILADLLNSIKKEKDAQRRQKLIEKYDKIAGELTWYDDEGYVHVICFGAKSADERFGEFDIAKKRAESSLRRYVSILGVNERGRDLRDSFGRVWHKVVNKVTGKVLQVEIYDLAGNLETIFAEGIQIDPLTRTVTADTRTDIEYDADTYQMIGSHTYRIDENGEWISDISEGIYRGYTPDKNCFVIDRHLFLKDDNGKIIYKDGKPRFIDRIEYYMPEGDLAAQVIRNIICIIKYGENNEITKEIYLGPLNTAVVSEKDNLDDLTRGRVWVRRYRSTSKMVFFKEALMEALTALPDDERAKAADAILNRIGAEKTGRISEGLLLEENDVTCNLDEDPASLGEAPYITYYEPGDSLGRQRIIIRGGMIEIPVEWVPETEISAKTLVFNLIGELISVSEVDKEVRADSVLDPDYMNKVSVLGIQPDTLLPRQQKKIYRLVTGPDGMPHYTNTVAVTTVSYMIPYDVLGRALIEIKYDMLGDDTTLHKDSTLMLKRNIFNQDLLMELWEDERGEKRKRAVAAKKETVIYEWYKEGMNEQELKAALIEEMLYPVSFKKRVKNAILPKTAEELEVALREGSIRRADITVKLKELKEALADIKRPPLGVLPGYHTIKPNKRLGEVKYFAGIVDYPSAAFAYPRIKVAYEPEVEPFTLLYPCEVRGVKYNVLNSDYVLYDVHSLSGQMIVLGRRYTSLRLMNMFPLYGGEQIEYYDPFVPYSYLKPIKIEKYFREGTQPSDEKPGMAIIGVFLGDATIYHKNGWQTQTFLERRPFDLDHWIRSDYFFDEEGIYKKKIEHIEDSSLHVIKTTNWLRLFVITSGAMCLAIALALICDRRMRRSRAQRIRQVEDQAKAHISPKGVISPFSKESLSALEKILASYTPSVSAEAIEELKAACINVYEYNDIPVKLFESVKGVYNPLIEERMRSLGADPSDYRAATENLFVRIANRVGREAIDMNTVYQVEVREFEEWSKKLGSHFSFRDGRLLKDATSVKDVVGPTYDELTYVVLFRLIFDESAEFKGTIAAFRYYLFDKCINMIIAGQLNSVLKEIQGDAWAFLEALRPGYGKRPKLTKASIFTYEDMKDLFEGKRPGFLSAFLKLTGQDKEKKLSYLAAQSPQSTTDLKDYRSFAWLKTFPDKIGFIQFIYNLSPFWRFLTPIFFVIIVGGSAIVFDLLPFSAPMDKLAAFLVEVLSRIINIPAPIARVFIQITALVAVGIMGTFLMVKSSLGNFTFSGDRNRYYFYKKAMWSFWAVFLIATYIWGIFSISIIVWSMKVLLKVPFLIGGWGVFVKITAVLLTSTFIVSSFFSLFYIVIAVFGYFEGRRQGVGQILSWSKLKNNFTAAEKRFSEIMIPADAAAALNRRAEMWKRFWNIIIDDLYNSYRLTDEESRGLRYSSVNSKPDLNHRPKYEEAEERLRFYINGWLMEMPKADFWTDLPSFTAMITAFNETVSFSFDELNESDRGACVTRINHLIDKYRSKWSEFVDRLNDAEIGRWVTKRQLKSLSGLKKVPEGLPDDVKEKIRRWANLTVQCVERAIIETSKIREAFCMFARICYPEEPEEEIARLVDNKVQILLNYEGYHSPTTKDSDRVVLRRLMKEFPHLEVYWDAANDDYTSGEAIEAVNYEKGADAGLHKYNPKTQRIETTQTAVHVTPPRKGKPSGLNQALSFVRGETVLFFDANCGVRVEDAVKIPVALSEFRDDPTLGEVLFSEYILNKDYSWVAQAIAFNEETFVSVMQRSFNIFESCSFYGHSAIIRMDAMTSSSAFPQDYISEDILLGTSLWQKGYRTTHKEYLRFGKGRETSYFSNLVPITKWAMGAAEIAIGRVIPELIASKRLHIGQKFMLIFSFSFFYQAPLVFIINFLYLWVMVCWGINGFMAVPYPIIFGIIGLCFNQSIAATGIAYILEKKGFLKSSATYLKLVAKNHFFYAAMIPAYAFGFLAGLKGKAIFIISPKGWNLGHFPLKIIWGERRAVLMVVLLTTAVGIPLLYLMTALKIMPLWLSPFIPFLPFMAVVMMYFIGRIGERAGIEYLRQWRKEVMPEENISQLSVIKLHIIYAMILLVFVLVGFVMWGIVFSSLAVKSLFLFSVIYISTTLSFILMPLLAHSQPIAIFKEVTTSKLWNYFLIPSFSLAVIISIGSMISGAMTRDTELGVYICFGVMLLAGWMLLRWKLSGYSYLDRWLCVNLPSYKKSPIVLKSDLMDDIYFDHQKLLQISRGDQFGHFRFLQSFLNILLVAVVSITLICYFLYEFKVGFYSPWLWSLVAAVAVAAIAVNIRGTSLDRFYLTDMISRMRMADIKRISENIRTVDDIWGRLSREYKKRLLVVYEDEVRAKKAFLKYISSCANIFSEYPHKFI